MLVSREFEELFGNNVWGLTTPTKNQTPGYHVSVNEVEHLIEVALVGMSKNDVTVDVEDNKLTIVAKSESKSKFVNAFKQTFLLAKDSDSENVAANLENGLLTVRVPRVKPVKRVVNVNVV